MTQNHGSSPQGPVQRGVIGYKRLSPTACLTCHLLKATEVNPKESFGTTRTANAHFCAGQGAVVVGPECFMFESPGCQVTTEVH